MQRVILLIMLSAINIFSNWLIYRLLVRQEPWELVLLQNILIWFCLQSLIVLFTKD